ncbi:TPA: bestrophin family ion channel [Escherichia coli]
MQSLDPLFARLSRSKFRSRFRLGMKERQYCLEKGAPVIEQFALVVDLHYMTPFISVLISYTFISLDCLAEELEDPFGTENNDLPLDAICNAIEIDLLQMNDEAEIPAKILPDRHYQLT